ncbi:hypothetical protein CF335_g2709 [Tilletia laevis]|nr:hypothetical protein CF335_g2709 [Tilletia laevis]
MLRPCTAPAALLSTWHSLTAPTTTQPEHQPATQQARPSLSTMADYNNSSYDPYIPSGGAGGAAGSAGAPGAGNSRTAQIQSQIDDTIGVMRDNM